MVGSATGTQVGNAAGRNLASAIDFDTAVIGNREFVVVTEAREFNAAGGPPALPALQAGSISIYELLSDGSLVSTQDDLSIGNPQGSPFDASNQLTTCWIDFGADGQTFYASNAINASISSLSLDASGQATVINTVAAQGVSGFANGDTTYEVDGGSLSLVQNLTGDLPEIDTQGLVSVSGPPLEGAVYTMTNDLVDNEIAAFGINPGGALALIGYFRTGGLGSTEFDGGEGLDPLISADSIITTEEGCLVCVNAGSDTITSFRIEEDFSLTKVSSINSGGVGPNSLAYSNGRVFVSNIDRDGFALGDPQTPRGEPNDEGNITGFTINENGILLPIAGSTINLDNRPANVGFSADGSNLIVTSITAGSAALPGPNAANSVSVYRISIAGENLGMVGSATGTVVDNAEGRNLASAIDFDTTIIDGREIVVVTEAREFNAAGAPPALPALQAGSVSVYELLSNGTLVDIANDVALGDPNGSPFDPANQLTTCWIDFGIDGRTFYVSNAINASVSSFRLESDGTPVLLEQTAAAGVSGFATGGTTGPEVFGTTDGFIDLDVTDDGEYLYQLAGLSGAINAYAINDDSSLSLVQNLTGFLPDVDTQGLVTYSPSKIGDINGDGHIDFLDISPFIVLLTTGEYDHTADINADGAVDFLDISGFILLLSDPTIS